MDIPFHRINRVCVVDETGRAYERYGIDVTPSLQDDDRTLKLFLQEQEPKRSPTDEEVEAKAFEWAIDYKPWEDNLRPESYAEHGYQQGYKRALEDMS